MDILAKEFQAMHRDSQHSSACSSRKRWKQPRSPHAGEWLKLWEPRTAESSVDVKQTGLDLNVLIANDNLLIQESALILSGELE